MKLSLIVPEMPSEENLDSIWSAALESRRRDALLRARMVVRAIDSTHVEVDGQPLVNFCSNDYLALTHHPQVIKAVTDAAREHGAGSGASALVCGYTDAHAHAERALAQWKGTKSAVLLPSGYQANLAAIQTLAAGAHAAGRSIRFCLDRLSHASLIDAVRASGQPFRVFAHNDVDKLSRLLDRAEADQLQVVVTESIFSMDGDAAPLQELLALKARRRFVLLLDEAHGSGVYGPNGSGLASELGLTNGVDVFVVTLSKAMGLAGGAVCASSAFCEALVNFGRAYGYSTSVPPSLCAGCAAAMEVMRSEPWRQQRVRELAIRVRNRLAAGGLAIPAGDSPIIPIILGQPDRALAAARCLRAAGVLVQPIRPPTVPPAQSRLRVTLSAEHTDEEIERLTGIIATLN